MNIRKMPYIHRDLTWLSFNYRVLQEAKDKKVPLFERLKFLAIYSSNLDEYFRVRVAHARSLLSLSKKTRKSMDFDPQTLLKEIHQIVNDQQVEVTSIFNKEILPLLRKEGINVVMPHKLNKEQHEFVQNYFERYLGAYVQPVLLVKQKIRPFLNNAALYLAVNLETKGGNDRYAVVKIPSDDLPRFVELPADEDYTHPLIMLDDIVRHSVPTLFPGYKIKATYSIKLTRDAEIYIDDEYSGDLIEKIKTGLAKRNTGPGTRFVYDRKMPPEMLNFLMQTFSVTKGDLQPEGRYHNNFDLFGFPSFGKTHLKYRSLPPLPVPQLEQGDSIFEQMQTGDHLVHFPYQSYDYVIRFFEEAAHDPDVTHIQIVQYRVAKRSKIMDALKLAVDSGKQVTVFIEVKARFDEEANLQWANKLEQWGVKVLYSFPGLKVHAKLGLVSRLEQGEIKQYAYLSTGNFNEDTARIYGDFGFFTSDTRYTREMAQIFTHLERKETHSANPFKHLLVGQFGLLEHLLNKIDREIEHAQAGRPAHITIKVNSLEQRDIIAKLYEASQAGVKIRIIVRGICCLVAGVPGISDNIEAISIVDRFLEHARIYLFNNNGDEEIYLSSADWMTRNLCRRIECAFPLFDPEIRQEIHDYLSLQWSDNVKARSLNEGHENDYRSNALSYANRSQIEMYHYYKRKAEQARIQNEEDDVAPN